MRDEEFIEGEMVEKLAYISQELKSASTRLKFSPYCAVSEVVTEVRQLLQDVEREGAHLMARGRA